jgi:hypothetical protein
MYNNISIINPDLSQITNNNKEFYKITIYKKLVITGGNTVSYLHSTDNNNLLLQKLRTEQDIVIPPSSSQYDYVYTKSTMETYIGDNNVNITFIQNKIDSLSSISLTNYFYEQNITLLGTLLNRYFIPYYKNIDNKQNILDTSITDEAELKQKDLKI